MDIDTTRRRALQTLAAAALGGSATSRAQAPTPGRSITLVVPWPAGAPSDAMARRLQPHLQKAFGQPVVVENLGGAGGSLGVQRFLQLPADGQSLLVGTPTELMLSPLTLPAARYRAEDFSLIASFGRVPYVLCARAGLGVSSVAELLALAGRARQPLTLGNIGPGSLMQLLGLDFARATGTAYTHVPYRGLPPMLQDAMAGQLDLVFLPLAGSTVATIEQGRIRALGVTTARPSRLFPQFPTLASHPGLDAFDHDVWGGLFLRRETPMAQQERLQQWWSTVGQDEDFLAWSRSTGSDPLPVMSLAEARQFYARDVARYTALLKAFPEAVKT